MTSIEEVKGLSLNWVHTAHKNLLIDESMEPGSRQVRGYTHSAVTPMSVENPKIISISDKVMRETLEVTKEEILENPEHWAQILSGNSLPEGSRPIANCYCGNQFGVFKGQLGDGRAMTIGDIKNSKGDIWELQYKGAGKTPFSRTADGRAVLRSSIREFLCSEAIHSLGIPTTRANSIILSDTEVERSLLEDGKHIMEK